mmetsp:Transcript_65732/g.185760  ORF Transcript_65732/g.185760 Transcript_65732/m.185760 type:complete len:250 (+) Transcript_65732:1062-1811(+)
MDMPMSMPVGCRATTSAPPGDSARCRCDDDDSARVRTEEAAAPGEPPSGASLMPPSSAICSPSNVPGSCAKVSTEASGEASATALGSHNFPKKCCVKTSRLARARPPVILAKRPSAAWNASVPAMATLLLFWKASEPTISTTAVTMCLAATAPMNSIWLTDPAPSSSMHAKSLRNSAPSRRCLANSSKPMSSCWPDIFRKTSRELIVFSPENIAPTSSCMTEGGRSNEESNPSVSKASMNCTLVTRLQP